MLNVLPVADMIAAQCRCFMQSWLNCWRRGSTSWKSDTVWRSSLYASHSRSFLGSRRQRVSNELTFSTSVGSVFTAELHVSWR